VNEPAPREESPNFRRRRLAVVLLCLVLVAGGTLLGVHYSSPSAHAAGTPSAKSAKVTRVTTSKVYSVGLATCVFVDHSRSTRNYLTGVVTPSRTLRTEIRYPTLSGIPGHSETTNAHAATAHAPFPLVVFAHGYDVTPDTYDELLDGWVRAGMVVAAPIFPDTNAAAVTADHDSSLPEADDVNEPGDIAFVTHALIAAEQRHSTACPILHGLIATSKIALAGQSDGADAVAALAYSAAYALPMPPLRGVAVLSGSEEDSPTGEAADYRATPSSPPLLVVQSATDTCNPPQYSTVLYSAIVEAHRYFLDILLGDHLPPYTNTADPHDFLAVSAVTTKFLSLTLAGEVPGIAFMKIGNAVPTIAALTTGPAPVLSPLEQESAACYAS
jgi:hypothetical protein